MSEQNVPAASSGNVPGEKFGPHARSKMKIVSDEIEDLEALYGVKIVESAEIVRKGYGCAYNSFFESCGLTFPLPPFLLEILVDLEIALPQICPNMLRTLIALKVLSNECGLPFGTSEFHQLCSVKGNFRFAGLSTALPVTTRRFWIRCLGDRLMIRVRCKGIVLRDLYIIRVLSRELGRWMV